MPADPIPTPRKISWCRPLDGDGLVPFDRDDCVWMKVTDHQRDDGPFPPNPGDIQTVDRLMRDGRCITCTLTFAWDEEQEYKTICREVTLEEFLRRGHKIPARYLRGKAPRLDEPIALLTEGYEQLGGSHEQRVLPPPADVALPAPIELPDDEPIRPACPADLGPGPAGPPDGTSPSVGSDGPIGQTEAAAQQAPAPEEESAATGPAGSPRKNRRPAADTSGSKARPTGDPASRAVAAAMALRKAGKPVSVRAACKAAGVDRKNLTANHPETVQLIEQLAEPDREPSRGSIDRRTGSLDAWDDPEED
jgi:hypothetical protein